MIIYFYSNNPESADVKVIHDQLKKIGVDLASGKQPSAGLADINAVIIHGDSLDADANYFAALAIAESKPVLCLLSKKTEDKTVAALKDNKNFQSKVNVIFYQPAELAQQVVSFLKELDAQAGQEVANIKYTLRINQKIADYLNWKLGSAKRKKAFWLRDLLQAMMDNDQEYQKYKQKKYKVE